MTEGAAVPDPAISPKAETQVDAHDDQPERPETAEQDEPQTPPVAVDHPIDDQVKAAPSQGESQQPQDEKRRRSDKPWVRPNTFWMAGACIATALSSIASFCAVSKMNTAIAQTSDVLTEMQEANRVAVRAAEANEAAVAVARGAAVDSKIGGDRSFQAMLDQFRLDQRAWIGVKTAMLLGPLTPGKPIIVGVEFANAGKTPGIEFSPVLSWVLKSDDVDIAAYAGSSERRKAASVTPVPVTLFPGHSMTFRVPLGAPPGAPASDGVIKALLSGDLKMYVFGELAYRDVFGENHLTTFCYKYGVETGQVNPCIHYNEAR